MNPNIDKLPVPNTAPAGIDAQSVEVGASVPVAERAPSQEVGRTAPPQAVTPVQTPASNMTGLQSKPTTPSTNATSTVPPVSDLDPEFEKKWVNAAKIIVERTKGDPHLQSQELSKTGEEYRKRLGRRVDPNRE